MHVVKNLGFSVGLENLRDVTQLTRVITELIICAVTMIRPESWESGGRQFCTRRKQSCTSTKHTVNRPAVVRTGPVKRALIVPELGLQHMATGGVETAQIVLNRRVVARSRNEGVQRKKDVACGTARKEERRVEQQVAANHASCLRPAEESSSERERLEDHDEWADGRVQEDSTAEFWFARTRLYTMRIAETHMVLRYVAATKVLLGLMHAPLWNCSGVSAGPLAQNSCAQSGTGSVDHDRDA